MDSSLVTGGDVARTLELRLDPHYFVLSRHVSELKTDPSGIPLTAPTFEVRNGINLGAQTYDVEQSDSGFRYASVAAISQFALRPEQSTPLKEAPDAADPTKISARADELWLTRSGTPGIAWPARLAPTDQLWYPSGFLIRIRSVTATCRPDYVTAILNHPLWRVWSASLAAGKRQRNLGHMHLAQIRVPQVTVKTEDAIQGLYEAGLARLSRAMGNDLSTLFRADSAIQKATSFKFEALALPGLSMTEVPLDLALGRSGVARLDPNFHRADLREVVSRVGSLSHCSLRTLLEGGEIIKGGQPVILDEDFGNDPRVIASVALQAGDVQDELTKPTSQWQLEAAGSRAVREGDVLLAMDGYSAGKAGYVGRAMSAVTDSHVAILRLKNPDLAQALVCYLSSSLCQAQIKLALSGSSAYQLAKADVLDLVIPNVVIERAPDIGDLFFGPSAGYEPVSKRVRHGMAAIGAEVSERLLLDPKLGDNFAAALRDCRTAEQGFEYLSYLVPEMF